MLDMLTILDGLAQAGVVYCGLMGIFMMAQSNPAMRMYGAMTALMGEPFWLITMTINGQWTIMVMAFVYAANYWNAFTTIRGQVKKQLCGLDFTWPDFWQALAQANSDFVEHIKSKFDSRLK